MAARLGGANRMDERRHAMVRELVEEERIPFSVVAPFRTDHPRFAAVDPFVIQNSSKGGTLDRGGAYVLGTPDRP